jgi:N-terminal domain of galactosyltransferase
VIGVVIPWRDDGQHRSALARLVTDELRLYLPGSPVLMIDSGHEPFNRAASRNLGIQCLGPGAVAVVCDADTLSEQAPLLAAIAAAEIDGLLHYPFTVCHYLTLAGTELVLAGDQPDEHRTEFSIPGAQGGIMVMRTDAWQRAGGMCESFIGWGYEDNAWHAAVWRTLGRPVRHEGTAWHLWHPAQRYSGSPDELDNLDRARKLANG